MFDADPPPVVPAEVAELAPLVQPAVLPQEIEVPEGPSIPGICKTAPSKLLPAVAEIVPPRPAVPLEPRTGVVPSAPVTENRDKTWAAAAGKVATTGAVEVNPVVHLQYATAERAPDVPDPLVNSTLVAQAPKLVTAPNETVPADGSIARCATR